MTILGRIIGAIRQFCDGDMTKEEVERVLDAREKTLSERLAWRTSIVDLLKLLDLDSSLAARRELARELGYEGPLDDSAAMNTWLHQAVMRDLETRYLRVPGSK